MGSIHDSTTGLEWLPASDKGLYSSRKTKILKLIHNWSFRNPKRNFKKSHCSCGHIESISHLFQCHLNSEKVSMFITRINRNLQNLRTHRPVRENFISYFHQVAPTPWGPRKAQLENAIQEQKLIGNNKIILVLLVQRWADIQESIYPERNERKELTG